MRTGEQLEIRNCEEKMKLREVALVCSAIGALLYMNTLDCGYCFDDHSAIELNPDLLPQTPWGRLLANDFWGTPMSSKISHKSYRPLTVATFRLNYMLHELQPLGYHLVNVLLHSAVCYLYVLLCGVVFSEVWPALIAGLLFAVHPIHTEAVAGIVGRAELLSSIFYLLTIFSYRKATRTPGCTRVSWFCVTLMSILCSALSKEQGIMAVAVCMAYDILYCVQIDTAALLQFKFNRNQPRKCRQEKSASATLSPQVKTFFSRSAILILFSSLFMLFRMRLMGGSMPNFYLEETNPAVLQPTPLRQLYWLYLCFSNIWLLLSPSSLCADWANGTIPLIYSFVDVRNIATLLLFVAVAILLGVAIQRAKTGLFFALSLLILPYLPASNLFFPVGFVVAERILYLPSIGFCMLLSIIYQELISRGKKWTRLLKPVLLLFLIVHSVKTVQRNRDWVSEETLWKSAVPVNSNNCKVFTNLAKGYEHRNDSKMVLSLLQHALRLQPNVMIQWVNVAYVLKGQGRLQEAEEHLRGALALVPKGKRIAFNVGSEMVNVYSDLASIIKRNATRQEEAATLFMKAASVEESPSRTAHWTMEAGNCYLQIDDLERAKEAFLSAFETNPQSVGTNYNLAVIYGKMEDFKQSETYLRRALAIKPDDISAVTSLASILSDSEDSRRQNEALLLLAQAFRLNPSDYKPLWRIGKLCMKRKEFDRAKSFFLQALKLDPSSVHVRYSLGKLYSEMELFDKAIEVLEEILTVAPNSKLGATLLAEAYRHTGNLERATELEHRHHDVSTADAKTLLSLARDQIRQNKFDLAENYFREALKDEGSEYRIEILFELGSLLAQRKKCSEAVQHLSSVLEIMNSGLNGRPMSQREREMRNVVVDKLEHCSQGMEREGWEGGRKKIFSTKRLHSSSKRPEVMLKGPQDVIGVRNHVTDDDDLSHHCQDLHTT